MKPIDEILHDFGCELAAHGLIDRHDIIGLQLPEKAFVELLGRVKSKVVRGPGSGKTDGLKDLVLVACDSAYMLSVPIGSVRQIGSVAGIHPSCG